MTGDVVRATSPDDSAPGITWEIEVPLLAGGEVVRTTFVVFALSALIGGSLVGLMLAVQGEWGAILPVFGMLGVIAGALFLVGLVAIVVVFRGDMRFRFTVDDEQVRCELVDTTARAVNRLTIVAGALAARPGAVGTGLIATSGEVTVLGWDGAFRAEYDPARRTIALRNGWRRLLVVYCTAENYAEVADAVRDRIAKHGTDRRLPAGSPVPRMLGYTVLVVIASLVAFPLADVSDVSLLLLLVMLCFGIAMIWLVSLFGYVVIGCIVAVVVSVVADAVSIRESTLFPGETYRHLDVFSEDDVVTVGIAVVGLVVLGLLAVRAVRGRLPSMLERDAESAGG
jgi:hypothetical protein